MSRAIVAKFAVSAALLGTVAIGCKPAAHPASLSSGAPRVERQAARRAAQATTTLARQKPARAVALAEKAVTLAPQAAAYRILLGRAYIAAGRFVSAEAALTDALALTPEDGQAEISLALVRIALGKRDAARDLLAQARGRVGESDRGLALALAGDADGGVAVLEQAARAEGADAKARQNYALGLALAGRWAESRSVAAQDLTPDQLKVRMTEWVRFSRPRAAWDQVAALLKVTPIEDGGMPLALALALALAPPPALAVSDVTPEETARTEVEVAETAPAREPASATQVASPSAIPSPRLVARAAVTPPPLIAAPNATARFVAASLRQSPRGRYAVQIGAYSSVAKAETAWRETARRMGRIAGLSPYSAPFGTPRGTMYRLSLGGIESRDAATDLCLQIRAASGTCFVRSHAGDALARWSGGSERHALR
ncbi:MAG: SPOR domain-containing protein [Sphingomonas sp.]